MENQELYNKAIAIASEAEMLFIAAHDEYMNGSHTKSYHRIAVKPQADRVCAQKELVAELFGVTYEQVHKDISNYIDEL